ncbi:tyrosine-type recombinase/integrase [Psychroserpens jangbogonensis]|uniref:tyrosine-type recombinase/integrase n=1 Tax=Psychroserpens jangbogonensis TaxID=1484460 RepID=UPI00053D0532|nr:tyrosine-type recombinase/integrase [Psychroserpens jangbogonensis]
MATITFQYISSKDYAPIYIRLEHKGKRYNAPTKEFIDKSWFKKHFKEYLKLTDKQLERKSGTDFEESYSLYKDYLSKLQPLRKYVLTEIVKTPDDEYSVSLLKNLISTYYNSGEVSPERLNLTHWIDHKYDNHSEFKNSKGGYGLSENTLKNIKTFLNNIQFYEDEELGRKMKLSDLTQDGINNFNAFLIDWSHRGIYKKNIISDVLLFGRVARTKGKMSLPNNFDAIEIPSEANPDSDEDVIYLNKEELDDIEKLELDKPYLINARKWLLLGCYTGQRGGDLINKVLPNVKDDGTIRFAQGKTTTKVIIPIHPKVKEILINPPHKISTQKCSDYFKEICIKAEINKPTIDYKRELLKEKKTRNGDIKKVYRAVLKERPKSSYIATHTCRRTFCMMYYGGEMTNAEIMRVTGHKKEATFLAYINKTDDTHIEKWKKHMENE